MNKLTYGLFLLLIFSFSPSYAEITAESMVQVLQRLENLERKTRELHGENEVLRHELQRLQKTQKEGFIRINGRINAVRSSINPQALKSQQSSSTNEARVKIVDKQVETASANSIKSNQQSSQTANTVTKEQTVASASKKIRAPTAYEKEVYQSAFMLMKKSPTAATRAFKEYIKLQPDSPLSANAQYWIGEIMYSHNNYKGAVQEFVKVLQKYKYSDKAPDAALKLGYSFYALKNWPFARRTFEDILEFFPENKNAVTLATRRLAKMKSAGH